LSGGTYKLYTVAHVYIEDYLCGVVPYEMGNSAPAEALKAQAVARAPIPCV
jgi:stage II sporulation protein D